MQDSQIAGGPGGVGDLRDSRKEGQKFGDLPDKLRDRVLQSKEDGFPSSYELILRNYYRRLAEQRVEESKESKPDGK